MRPILPACIQPAATLVAMCHVLGDPEPGHERFLKFIFSVQESLHIHTDSLHSAVYFYDYLRRKFWKHFESLDKGAALCEVMALWLGCNRQQQIDLSIHTLVSSHPEIAGETEVRDATDKLNALVPKLHGPVVAASRPFPNPTSKWQAYREKYDFDMYQTIVAQYLLELGLTKAYGLRAMSTSEMVEAAISLSQALLRADQVYFHILYLPSVQRERLHACAALLLALVRSTFNERTNPVFVKYSSGRHNVGTALEPLVNVFELKPLDPNPPSFPELAGVE
jgi:Cyclin, C-terminal domain